MRKLQIISYFCLSLVTVIGLMTIVASGGGGGGESDTTNDTPVDAVIDPYEIAPSAIETFTSTGGDICMEDGKPVIRMFSTTWCPHCQWISDVFDDVVQMYVDEGLIVAHHWELDTGDDTLTIQVEESVPESEEAIFNTFNPDNSIPTFVFGCRYYRIGNGHELQNDLKAEAAEFMAVIEDLLDSVQ